MEILMADDAFDTLVPRVSGGIRSRQHTGGVENIQPLVLHSAHVEAFHGNDHENIKIVFPPVVNFVPPHRVLQCRHGIVDFIDIMGLGENLQLDGSTTHRDKFIFNELQIAGHQRKQVRRFHERVLPRHPVALSLFSPINVITIGEQNRISRLVGNHRRCVL